MKKVVDYVPMGTGTGTTLIRHTFPQVKVINWIGLKKPDIKVLIVTKGYFNFSLISQISA